jgi:hypothetical protein
MRQDQLPKTDEMSDTRDVAGVGDLEMEEADRKMEMIGDDGDAENKMVMMMMMMESVEMWGAGEVGLKPRQACDIATRSG